jgi:folylpolyglutamate synthase/dihydropteroate synthase
MAVSANKDVAGIVAPLAPLTKRAYAARNESARSGEAERVAEAFAEAGVPVVSFGSVAEALEAARAAADEEDLILVTGSLYTVADARVALGRGT